MKVSAYSLWRERRLELTVFTLLEIVAKVDTVGDDIVRPSSKVHVTNGTSGKHQTRQHLRQVVSGNTVSVTGVKKCALRNG